MSMFTGTVNSYRRYRPGIPEAVADILDQATRPGRPRRLLDLGTGPGLVVQALLGRFSDIIAVDTDTDMLAAADAALRPTLPDDTTLVLTETPAERFVAPPGWQADLVTICRTFHWLDQPTVLQRLDTQVDPGGAVAILSDRSFWTADSPWKRAVRAVIQDFLGQQRRAGDATFTNHNRPYRDILAESPFNQVDETRVPVRRSWSTQTVLGYLYSTSFAAPHLFGDQRDAFEHALTATLAEFSDNDVFVEDNEFVVLIGRRGHAQSP